VHQDKRIAILLPIAICDKRGEAADVGRFVVISGCSGGGKSTLLAELGSHGYATVEEPGRRIVKEELKAGGPALPWVDEIALHVALSR